MSGVIQAFILSCFRLSTLCAAQRNLSRASVHSRLSPHANSSIGDHKIPAKTRLDSAAACSNPTCCPRTLLPISRALASPQFPAPAVPTSRHILRTSPEISRYLSLATRETYLPHPVNERTGLPHHT
ncbi:hypothetical protein BD310DRAFT_538508 [Dichomitus squalens]|uniref:Secreted protein n=1 Tax=Dichomitus squalens TaxID=114155 RepID=A0A4Q9PSZ1_9APHY|nr:hypothetical protein BD310DRAFT_538508 [Dichomitus squalens]